MKNITPEDIFKKLCERLEYKKIDLNILSNSGNKFEKWLQCELFITLVEKFELFPIIFDKDEYMISNNYAEKICEITMEYPFKTHNKEATKNIKKNASDLMVLEKTFLGDKVDENTWRIKREGDKETVKEIYNSLSGHFVELKVLTWEHNLERIEKKIVNDCKKKYSDLDGRSLTHYKPKSYISICCFSFDSCKIPKGSWEKKADEIKKALNDKHNLEILGPKQISNTDIFLIAAYRFPNKT